MQFYSLIYLVTLFWCIAAQPLSSSNVKLENMSDFEIAKMFIEDPVRKDSPGDIIYPRNNETWHVGQEVNVTFNEANYGPNETVSIFIFQHTEILAGGPLNKRVFPFIVPASAYTGPINTALLLAVKRKSLYLQMVDSVIIHVDN
ncbi:hypothetical protein G6F56_006382 [Rhizopus delemar]|nr:hypothetical protein G6F56_006382 [Rhizopus delemar]